MGCRGWIAGGGADCRWVAGDGLQGVGLIVGLQVGLVAGAGCRV